MSEPDKPTDFDYTSEAEEEETEEEGGDEEEEEEGEEECETFVVPSPSIEENPEGVDLNDDEIIDVIIDWTLEDKSSEPDEAATFFSNLATENEVCETIDDMEKAILLLRQENELLKHFAEEVELISEPETEGAETRLFPGHSRSAEMLLLTAAQKCHIVEKRVQELHAELEFAERSQALAREVMRAKEDEAELEQKEIKEELEKFDIDIRLGATHHVSKKIMAEKVDWFFCDSIKKTSIGVERIKMQLMETRLNKRKMIQKMNEKIEASKSLREVDIERTKQEHVESLALTTHYERLYYENRGRLNRLLQGIAENKKALSKETEELKKLNRMVKMKERTKEVFEGEKNIIERERQQCEDLKEHIRLNPRSRDMPTVMEYVYLGSDLEELNKKVKYWRSKVEAMKMAKYCRKGRALS